MHVGAVPVARIVRKKTATAALHLNSIYVSSNALR
jgi:hypothetical protein